VDGKEKPWGESAVAELANGSVVLTSRLSQPLTAASRWRAFAISHSGGESWDKAWTFPADQVCILRVFAHTDTQTHRHTDTQTGSEIPSWRDCCRGFQPFDTGFGPGYNCEAGLLSANNRTKLLLSHPTATLHGDSTGAPHTRCSPGSCVYRRNLTIAESDDGGASWSVNSWGLIYRGRVSYSDMSELPNGQIAVVFERGTAAEEYRYLSVAIASPPWA
jgi:hypothetical protein